MDAKQHLHAGNEYPYDASDEWQESFSSSRLPPPSDDWAHSAARGLIHNLQNRRGLRKAFDCIDEEIRRTMVKDIAEIIRESRASYSDGKLENKLHVLPDEIVSKLNNVFVDLRHCQSKMPSTGDIVLRQMISKVCQKTDDLLRENESRLLRDARLTT